MKTPTAIYPTATSLTARQINRRIILNIIYKQQPISRADTARETGLQRSTVSLIVDELINDGWIVEGEHVRIPRGRRPIYLQINSDKAGLFGMHISGDTVEMTVTDLNGAPKWTGSQPLADFSREELSNALRNLRTVAEEFHDFEIKGAGVSLDALGSEKNMVREVLETVFDVPVSIDCVPVACGKWFLLMHKDSKLAKDHLVCVNIGSDISLGIIVAGHPLRGAHGCAGMMLTDHSCTTAANGNGNTRFAGDKIEDLGKRLEFAVAAYDPGVILITGPLAEAVEASESALEKHLRNVGATDTAIRVIETGGDDGNIYLNGAVAVILSHFLDECPR